MEEFGENWNRLARTGFEDVDAADFWRMTRAEEKRLKALGAALRAMIKVTDETPAELQILLLRLLLRETEKLPAPHRLSA